MASNVESPTICIALLMGLPGAGKTTFTINFAKTLSLKNFRPIHICYDNLIQNNDWTEDTNWKRRRSELKSNVEEFIQILLQPTLNLSDALVDIVVKLGVNTEQLTVNNGPVVIFVDDNFYYGSMRYEYFQLAKKCHIGYCQLHIEATVEECLSRNRSRDIAARVPDQVILQMAEKFEQAKPFENAWEKFSFTLKDLQESLPSDICQSVVELALSHPCKDLEELNIEERNNSRIACSASVIHQADKVLRKQVNARVREAQKSNPTGFKEVCSSLNNCRNELLEDLRTGFTKLPSEVVKSVEGRADGAVDKLQDIISELFDLKLSTNDPTNS